MISPLIAHPRPMLDSHSSWHRLVHKEWLSAVSGRLAAWIESERARSSVMSVAFWYFSLIGGVKLLDYALYPKDPVFVLGLSLDLVIYSRNLWLIHAKPKG